MSTVASAPSLMGAIQSVQGKAGRREPSHAFNHYVILPFISVVIEEICPESIQPYNMKKVRTFTKEDRR